MLAVRVSWIRAGPMRGGGEAVRDQKVVGRVDGEIGRSGLQPAGDIGGGGRLAGVDRGPGLDERGQGGADVDAEIAGQAFDGRDAHRVVLVKGDGQQPFEPFLLRPEAGVVPR